MAACKIDIKILRKVSQVIGLIFFTVIFFCCKPQKKHEQKIENDTSNTIDYPDSLHTTNIVESICKCTEKYRAYMNYKEELKFAAKNIDLMSRIVEIEQEMTECVNTKININSDKKSAVSEKLSAKCPEVLQFIQIQNN
jgi:preprotein translocase subunit YajC